MRGFLTTILFGLLLSLASPVAAQEAGKTDKAGKAKSTGEKKPADKKKVDKKKAPKKKPADKKKVDDKKKSSEKKPADKKPADKKAADKKAADKKAADKKKEKPASVTSRVPAIASGLQRIFAGSEPKTIADLKGMESHLRKLVDKVTPATVGIFNGAAGSGVIITPDGYVLTAAHVAMQPGRSVRVVLHDGRIVRGTTLGLNKEVDAGLIKITTEGVWPYAEMGNSKSLRSGQWCLALGHPGGFQADRRAPVRFGRIISTGTTSLRTDCTLVGGDSGGPLFDLNGRVIGIHSRISRSIQANVHVPVAHYSNDWDQLVNKEIIERTRAATGPGAAYLGVTLSKEEGKENVIIKITKGAAAEKAGMKPEDRIVKFNGRTIRNARDLRRRLSLRSAGDKAALEVERSGKTLKFNLVLGTPPKEN